MANVYFQGAQGPSEFLANMTDFASFLAIAQGYYAIELISVNNGVATVGTTDTDVVVIPPQPNRYSIIGLYVSCTTLQSNANLFVNLTLGGGTGSGAMAAGVDATAQQKMNATTLDVIGGTVGVALLRKMTAVIPALVIPDNADPRVPAGKSISIQCHDDATHHMAVGSIGFTIVAALRA